MKISIGFLLLFGYSVFVIVAGSDNEAESVFTISAEDFPYFIIDTKISWETLLEKLNDLKLINEDIGKIMDKNKELLEITEIRDLLRGLISQHCITYHLIKKFPDDELVVLKKAMKEGLLMSKARVESNYEIVSIAESMEPSFQKLEFLLNDRLKDKSYAHKMIQIAKYTIRSRLAEYVTISLVNSKIASFLTGLFTVLDKGLPNKDFFYISEIVTWDEVDKLLIEHSVTVKERKDAVNFMLTFQSIHANVEDYLAIPPRNPRQIEFQNFRILNHCYQVKMIEQLPPLGEVVLDDARKLKLENFRIKFKIFIDNIFEYQEIVDDRSFTSPLTLADLQSEKSISEKLKTLDRTQIDHLDFILGGWIAEKILMSAVSQEMYKPLIRIFHYIDNQSDESKKAVEAVLAIEWPRKEVQGPSKLN